ncbi:DUF7706 family protein [Methylomonas sp. 11b]|uniref:DUF7706 family protein n=1 Tax=Methylomonas sp. 11b TaxID=1168169 RepID=UPI00047E6637|nr:hypothetical protein [Methylomonas sp. 11b]
MIEIKLELLNEDEAEALAQFLKRTTLTDVSEKAKNESEKYTMFDAIFGAQRSLANAGYNPR